MKSIRYCTFNTLAELTAPQWLLGAMGSLEQTQRLAESVADARDARHVAIGYEDNGGHISIEYARNIRRSGWHKVNSDVLTLAQYFDSAYDQYTEVVDGSLRSSLASIDDPAAARIVRSLVALEVGINATYAPFNAVHVAMLQLSAKVGAVLDVPLGDWSFIPLRNTWIAAYA